MDAVSSPALAPSNKLTAGSGSDFDVTAGSGSDEENWFSIAARGLLGKDAGLALHYATGFPERTCYYYASGMRKLPAFFLRRLLRSGQGWQWLCAVMEGSGAPWWRELQRARRIAEFVDNLD